MAWAAAVNAGVILVLVAALCAVEAARRKTKKRLLEAQRERDDIQSRMADLVATIDLLVDSDPDLDELSRMSEAAARSAAGAGGGMSEVEQAAVDRLLRAGAAGGAGNGGGG